MSSDFETYEQDFGTITAEVTNKIGKIPKLSGEEKTQLVLNVDKQLEEVRELLEQMDLEVREIPIQSRAMYNSRLKSYKQEVEKLEKDFKRSRIAYSDEVRNELLGDDAISSESQLIKLREERAHLLDNTERLERSSRRLEAGYQIAVETVERNGRQPGEEFSHPDRHAEKDHPESHPGLRPRRHHPSHHHLGHLFKSAKSLIFYCVPIQKHSTPPPQRLSTQI
ncbi:vesicle transport through interaction with t-SNAREs homolog 1A isoform X2 [Poecilia formosa]|uniref:vesicle transport through interaction with t-SNAREs homolog 1A isoform X2 n=1 Tax=Poecilia formosa TaxID=48698 RepID=UPI000444194C|nr:PREDICTED: vesicle transport through interaction with t-SNAREs homolog 1A isoform X2 [Poecilia formosa]